MEHKRTIVFICTGNTCRSPMAKAIFSDKLPERYCDNFEVESAGIMPQEGESAAENSVLALAQIGIDITNHSAQKITKDMLSKAELFICMSAEHQAVLEKMGVSPQKLMTLNISDPYGGDLERYLLCRDLISSQMHLVFERLGI